LIFNPAGFIQWRARLKHSPQRTTEQAQRATEIYLLCGPPFKLSGSLWLNRSNYYATVYSGAAKIGV